MEDNPPAVLLPIAPETRPDLSMYVMAANGQLRNARQALGPYIAADPTNQFRLEMDYIWLHWKPWFEHYWLHHTTEPRTALDKHFRALYRSCRDLAKSIAELAAQAGDRTQTQQLQKDIQQLLVSAFKLRHFVDRLVDENLANPTIVAVLDEVRSEIEQVVAANVGSDALDESAQDLNSTRIEIEQKNRVHVRTSTDMEVSAHKALFHLFMFFKMPIGTELRTAAEDSVVSEAKLLCEAAKALAFV